MWKRIILPTAVMLVLAITLTVQPAYAEPFVTNQKLEHKDITLLSVNPDGSRTYQMTPVPSRIWDEQAQQYKEYKLFEDSNIVRLETGNAGSIEFNKNTCSYNLYKSGYIDELNPLQIGGISWTVKGKAAGASTWSNVNTINNAACSVSVQTTEATVKIIGEKSASSGIFQIVLDYVPGRGIKETFRAYNNNPAWTNHNIGFTETMTVPRIINFGNNTYDLANYNGTVLGRNWIENNEAKIVRFTENSFYDFGIGFENLNDVKITWDGSTAKLSFNYLYPTTIVPYQTWFEVDPTLNFDTSGTTALCANAGGAVDQQRCGNYISDSAPRGASLNSVTLRMYKVLSPTGSMVAELRTVSGDTLVATSTTSKDVSTLTTSTSGEDVTFTFASPIIPSADFRVNTYYTGGDGSNYVFLLGTASNTVANQQFTYTFPGTTWNNVATSDIRGSMIYTFSPPNPPTNFNCDSVSTKVSCTWTASSPATGVTGYFIGRSLDNSTYPAANKTSTGNVTSYLISTYWRPGLFYYVNITAANANGNSTAAYDSFTMDDYPDAPRTLYRTNTNATTTKLNWLPPLDDGGSTVTGYRVERATGYGCTGFSILTNHTTSLNYNNTGLSTTQQYCYRVGAWNGVGLSPYSNSVYRFTLPNAVDDLNIINVGTNSVDLEWTQPSLGEGTLSGYMINFTSPHGTPNTMITNNTLSAITSYTVNGLTDDTEYSFRIGVWTTMGLNASGNIEDTTTFALGNFTIGFFNLNTTNPEVTPIRFVRTDVSDTETEVKVIYPNSANMTCVLDYQFARQSDTYSNLAGAPYSSNFMANDFLMTDHNNEIISFDCTDIETNNTATYVLQQSDFALKEQIENFRNGTYGTMGMIGYIDLVTLVIFIFVMIGFNRINPSVGAIMSIAMLGAIAYFEIITIPGAIFGAVAVVVMLIIGSTRKDD